MPAITTGNLTFRNHCENQREIIRVMKAAAKNRPQQASPAHSVGVHPAGSRARVLLIERLRALRPGRRVRQPGDEPDGAVPQPGDADAGAVFAADVPSQLGAHAHPGEHPGPLHGAGLPARWSASSRRSAATPYDVVGITSIIPNQLKVKKMCELVRQYQPQAKIVVGGHIANVPDLAQPIDADLHRPRRGRRVVPPLPGRGPRPAAPPSA